MGRRGLGLAILLLAAFALLVVPRALREETVTGDAIRGPFPEPPPIGACIDGAQHTGHTEVVPCTEPHTLEITARWLADDPDNSVVNDREVCRLAGSVYIGLDRLPSLGDWGVNIAAVETPSVYAARDERIGKSGWTACAVAVANRVPLSRSLRNAFTTPTFFPGELSQCLARSGSDGYSSVACSVSHSWEVLATAVVPAEYTDVVVTENSASYQTAWIATAAPTCADLAANLIGTPDPTFGGELSLGQEEWFAGSNQDDLANSTATVACVIRVADDRELVGSLIGLGDGPLPWAS